MSDILSQLQMRKSDSAKRFISIAVGIIFICYCLLLFFILFYRRIPTELDFERYPYWIRIRDNINLIPFDTISEQLNDIINDSGYFERLAILNLSANILMFVPMGWFLPLLLSKLQRFSSFLTTVFMMIISVELVQLFTLTGSCDIDDLILNLIGCVVGFLLFQGMKWLRQNHNKYHSHK